MISENDKGYSFFEKYKSFSKMVVLLLLRSLLFYPLCQTKLINIYLVRARTRRLSTGSTVLLE